MLTISLLDLLHRWDLKSKHHTEPIAITVLPERFAGTCCMLVVLHACCTLYDFYIVDAMLAMQSTVLATADLSICLSVMCWGIVHRNEDTIMQSSVSCSTLTSFWRGKVHSQGITPLRALK